MYYQIIREQIHYRVIITASCNDYLSSQEFYKIMEKRTRELDPETGYKVRVMLRASSEPVLSCRNVSECSARTRTAVSLRRR